jgi:hypothetical protein
MERKILKGSRVSQALTRNPGIWRVIMSVGSFQDSSVRASASDDIMSLPCPFTLKSKKSPIRGSLACPHGD